MRISRRWFIAAILAAGVFRFALSVAGVADAVVKYVSMTALIIAGTIYFGVVCTSHKERLKTAYLLILPYMVVEIAALGYTWMTGRMTIFHAPQYSLGSSIAVHTIGHLVGGLTWEPLIVFAMMEIVGKLYRGGRKLLRADAES